MEYHTAITAASVVVQIPVRMLPNIMINVRRAGNALGMVMRACLAGMGEHGIAFPFLVK